MRRAVVAALLGASLLPGQAVAADPYRQITLDDGRVLVGKVLSTQATGLRVGVPQGVLLIPFPSVRDMVPANQSVYDAQPEWVVYLAGPTSRHDALSDSLHQIPSLKIYGDPGTERHLDQVRKDRAELCRGELNCVVEAIQGANSWTWVVGAYDTDDGLALMAAGPSQPPASAPMSKLNASNLASAQASVFGFDDASDNKRTGSTTVLTASGDTAPADVWTENKVLSMAFIPVPGLPSIMQGDGSGFALAWAITLPTTAGWVMAFGKNSTSKLRHILLSAGGAYITMVAANSLLGLWSRSKSIKGGVAVGPADRSGGFKVQIAVQLK